MACSQCGAKALIHARNAAVFNQKAAAKNVVTGPCDFTIPMLQNFHDKLVWFKNKALYRKHGIAPAKMNRYIGIVLSAMNISNPCTHETILIEIADLVDLIVNVQTEQNV